MNNMRRNKNKSKAKEIILALACCSFVSCGSIASAASYQAGTGSTATGDDATSIGITNTANGSYTTAVGNNNTASAASSTAIGRKNTVSGGADRKSVV